MTMSAGEFGPGSLTYTDQRIRFFGDIVERWQADHAEAGVCFEVEQVLRDMRRLLDDIFAVDSLAQRHALDNREDAPELASAIEVRLRNWVGLAEVCAIFVQVLERQGFEVEGAAAFRAALDEGKAALDPNDELPPEMAALRDAAVAELAAGETDVWQ